MTKGNKNNNRKKKKKKNGKNNKRPVNKKNKASRMKGKKAANKETGETKISRYEETKLDDSKSQVIQEDFGPFGNFFKSLVTRNTYL